MPYELSIDVLESTIGICGGVHPKWNEPTKPICNLKIR